MKVSIKVINDAYHLLYDDEDQGEIPVKQPKGWDETLFLPENPTNRKLVNKGVADKAIAKDGELVLKEVAPKVGHSGPRAPKKADIEYLNDEEKAIYNELMEKIRQRREAEKAKAKDPKEILRQKIAKYEAQLRAMEE